jgi:3-isopropylmalate/(R)-2-methylmalate dehydratase small subunit
MNEAITGTVAVFGDFIAADTVLPARHGFLPAADAVAHLMGDLGGDANARLRTHPILVAGEAFGYGTGRESPARALKAAGVRAIIAVSFARMFYRNAINNGILALECAQLVRAGIEDGDEVQIESARLRWNERVFPIAEVPPLVRQIIAAGDLIAYGRKLLAAP